MTTLEILDACKGIVMNCHVNILILKITDIYQVFVVTGFTTKTKETLYNEVIEGQNITSLLHNIQFNFLTGFTEQTFFEKIQSIPKESFKFGTDDFFFLTKVVKNGEH